jgi:3alpha(or 20beta)-hydroxysteroid dehydrogenase
MGRLDGKVAVVTGAARGTGAVTARLFVEEGAKVMILDVLDDRAKVLADELGENAHFQHCDITEESDWTNAFEATIREFGAVDVLVNNAAVLHVAPIAMTSVDDYVRVATVNQIGTFLGIRSAIKPMEDSGGGSIINISSTNGLSGVPGTVAYGASKWAIRGIGKTAAVELGHRGIRVNTICPATGNPEMVDPFLPPGLDIEGLASQFPNPPVGRRGELIDVARLAVFLASEDSSFFTGFDFNLDGGYSAGPQIEGAPGM